MITRRTTIMSGLSATAVSLIPSQAFACGKTVRIIVSLADNANQGIVPIRAALGNGQDPDNNLYWGAMYGVKSFFKRETGWQVTEKNPETFESPILDAVYLNRKGLEPSVVSAEAWDGAHQKQTTKHFMRLLKYPEDSLTIFVGHNPLMDEFLTFPKLSQKMIEENRIYKRKFAVIACQSRRYFEQGIKATGHEPYVLTAGNMAPEAYVIEAIIRAWMENKPAQTAREYAAIAYAKYQKIPIKNANWLFGV